MQPGHPERPERQGAVLDALRGLSPRLEERTANPATMAELAAVHDPLYLAELAALAPREGLTPLDPDTSLCPATLHAAALAAGAVADAVAAVLDGSTNRAFCAVRPPGHHAEAAAAMGFCFYNNVAFGAQRALEAPGIERVAIIDFDVHLGNGTLDIFKDRPEVLVCSTFQHPFYPHRYHDLDRPNVVNTPLPAGTGSAAFRRAVETDWTPALEAHRPDFVLVSAGFDGHRDDPLAELELTAADFRWVTEFIVDRADRHAAGRVVSALEGGYDLRALAESVCAHVTALT
jgi:acetoin utilization deacetylase AcuC-like enzyme